MRGIIYFVKRNKFSVIAITAFVASLVTISLIFASIFGNGKTEQSENGDLISRLTLGSAFTLDDIKKYLDYDHIGIDKNDKITIYSVNNEGKKEPSDKIIARDENGDFSVRGVGKFVIEIIDTADPTVKIELFEESRFISSKAYGLISDTYPEITRDSLVTCEELLEVKRLAVSRTSSLETDDFKYMPSLSRIELISDQSETVTVGRLPNEQIKIYVPEYLYEKYMLDKSFDSIRDRVFTLGRDNGSVSVVIHKNGGSTSDDNDLAIDSEFVSSSSKIDLSKYTQMKRTGYLLKGIYRLSGAERVYVNENNIYTADTKLYAEWEAITYQIAFDENAPKGYNVSKNSIKMENTSCEYDVSKALSKSTLDITGWHFVGWSLTPDGVATIKDGDSIKNISSTNDECVTLYAKWAKNKYTISFDSNLPETESTLDGAMGEADCTFDVERSLPEIGFKLKGYTFIGWSLSKDGSVAYSDIAVVKNLTAENGKRVTLYAKWRPNKYVVNFDLNAPNGNLTNDSMPSISCSYDAEKALPVSPDTFGGWFFKGWSTTENGSAKYADRDTVKNLTATNGGSVTLYAVWGVDPYTIAKYSSNGKSLSDTDAEKTYVIYKESSKIPENIIGQNIIIDLSSTSNGVCNVSRTVCIKNASHIYFIGNSSVVYNNLNISTYAETATSATQTIHLKNFKIKGCLTKEDGSADINLTIDCLGDNSISAPNTSSAIDKIKSITFTGTGNISITAGNGVKSTIDGGRGTDGATAIITDELIVDMAGTISVYGGRGGDGAQGYTGARGADLYGEDTKRAGTGQAGGRGGDGGAGGWAISPNCVITAKNGQLVISNGSGGQGGRGGTGGIGGHAYYGGFMNLYCGSGGHGGRGGTGGTGGANPHTDPQLFENNVTVYNGSSKGGTAGTGGSPGGTNSDWFDGGDYGHSGEDGDPGKYIYR
ncbi:MAG: InlB B-repeat-containing protein [Clostridia bacterium]|nr:InlB B-repeat-containing protein [Clostridia bacterium]MBQ8739765.1 InlB B-repeat-containing protein [Clostridia bacterium]